MTIHIIDESPDLYLTREEFARLMHEYQNAMSFYAGPPIPFESWVRNRGRAVTTTGYTTPNG